MPMDEQDYRALIALTQEELRRVGAPGLADPERYVYRIAETGERRRLDPKKQLMEYALSPATFGIELKHIEP